MKKFLLFMLVAGFATVTFGQKQMEQKKNPKVVADGQEVAISQTLPTPVLNTKAVNEDVNRIFVGKSGHERTFRREESRVISYNPDLDMMSITFLLDPATYPVATEIGIVGQFYSTDHGQTWQGPVVIGDDLSQGPNWYPAGAFFSPDGNTSTDGIYGVMQSAISPSDGGDWRFKAFGSNDFVGASLDNQIFEEADATIGYNGYWNFIGIEQIENEMRCLNIIPTGAWGAFEALSLEPQFGTFNGSSFDWEFGSPVELDLVQGSDDGVAAWIGMWQGMDTGAEIAWSNDGTIGYMWVVGVTNSDLTGYQPIVFKTTDGGQNWDYIYLDFFTDEMQDFLYPYIQEATGGLMIPHVFESAGVVNANGNLELITAMGSTAADVINYPDSIGYYWSYPGDLFNITVTDDGIGNIIWVDSLRTTNVLAATVGNYCGTEGWQHRLMATKSPDANQIMFTWIETRDMVNNAENLEPDLFGWAKNVAPNGMVMDGSICFTEGTLYETFYYFTSAANIAIDNGGYYTIPVLQAVTPGEFASNGSTSADPVSISYITGIEFPSLIDGIAELETKGAISVAQNQPNPFTGTTTITISSTTVAPVSVEVTNMLGQVVYTQNAGTINGTMNVELNASQLEAGVYFYTVRVGADSVTKKMIVE